jgi:hypothetical protein
MHRASGMKEVDLRQDQAWLVDMARQAGVDADPQVAGALALLAHTIAGLQDREKRAQAEVEAAAMSRGIYHREVTSLGQPGYERKRTFVVAERMRTSLGIGQPPPPPIPKPGKKE